MNRISLKVRQYAASLTAKMNPRIYFSLSYLHNHKRIPSFKNPKDLSELWISRLLRGDFLKCYYLADKYLVRDYISSKGYSNLLTPLIGVYDNFSDIDFTKLPNRFALKMNCFAGMNYICTDKTKIDLKGLEAKVNSWKQKKLVSFSERHYNLIEPKLVCEEFIDDGSGKFPTDYKFICLKGHVECVLACKGREKGRAHYSPYTPTWVPLPYYRKDGNFDIIPKPKNLEKMIAVAEDLSKEFEMIRVDLYSNGDRIWFGEMTLTPAGCMFHHWSNRALSELGAKFYSH